MLLTYLLAQKYGAERLLAVHVHHGIRGAEADRDVELGVGISGTHNVLGKARRVAQLLLAQCE